MGLRLAFMGTPAFAVPALEALLDAGHDIACVYSQPPRRAGRGKGLKPSPVQHAAQHHGLMVRTPENLKAAADQQAFAALDLDAAVVVAYGLILPRPVLAAPRLGCLNIHASLLPRWRGAAPIQRAIAAGDTETGIAIMAMDAGLDTGPVLLREATPIAADETAGALAERLAAMGARLIVKALDGLAAGTLTPQPQPEAGISYARKIDKAEARLRFDQPAAVVARQIRALNPDPGGFVEINGERIKILAAEVVAGTGAPGEVLAPDFTIACAAGAIRPTWVQRAGKAPMPLRAFLNGFGIAAGQRLDAPCPATN
ncbi:MAG: methionyl-tRNA formyltransferase [Sphingomonadales bacterium]